MSEYRRFFAEASERRGGMIYIRSEYNHIAKVLRMKSGEQAVVCFDDGIEHLCTITAIDSSTVTLRIDKSYPNESESSIPITLFCGCLKGDNLDLVVQKAVELGVSEIVPFTSRFTVSDCNEKKAERLTKIAHEASKQCGRARLVTVSPAIGFVQLLVRLPAYDQRIFAYEKGGKPLSLAVDSAAKSIAVVIGSEGGFSAAEARDLSQICTTVTLGKRILRAETANIVSLALINDALSVKSDETTPDTGIKNENEM